MRTMKATLSQSIRKLFISWRPRRDLNPRLRRERARLTFINCVTVSTLGIG